MLPIQKGLSNGEEYLKMEYLKLKKIDFIKRSKPLIIAGGRANSLFQIKIKSIEINVSFFHFESKTYIKKILLRVTQVLEKFIEKHSPDYLLFISYIS